MSFSGFPKGLGFAFSKMSGFTKQIDIVYPDRRDEVSAGSRIRVKINPNTHIGLRTLNMYYNFTVPAVGPAAGTLFIQNRFAPRLSSSILQNIALYLNNNLIDTVDEYNLLYNSLYDLNSGQDQTAKRWLEGSDPSVKYVEAFAGNLATTAHVNTNLTSVIAPAGNTSDTARPFVINNFMNFLGTSSCEYLDTNDVGDFEIAITLANSTICWRSGADALAVAVPVALTYTLDNIYFTYERIILEDPLYYQIKESRLMSPEGLDIEYTTYSTHIGALSGRNINYSFNTSASSLNNIICTTRRADYNQEFTLLQSQYADGTAGALVRNWNNQLAISGANCFNQSRYFQRDLSSLTTSQLTINGTNMYKQPLSPIEIYNETILSLYGQNDLSHSVHPGLNSLPSFLQYYFTQILSLNYNKELKEHLISGLDGKSSAFNIVWKTTADVAQIAGNVNQIYPVVFCSKSQILKINAGRQISIMP